MRRTAVSDRGSRCGHFSRSLRASAFAAAALTGLLAGSSDANTLPTGPVFSPNFGGGFVIPHPTGLGQTVWLSGSTAVVNWNSYNIGAGNFVHYQSFTDPNFRILNRTNQPGPSMIQGQITGTGTVGLINPAGVVFYGSSVVNVGSFLAASANTIDESAFLNSPASGYSLTAGTGPINILPGAVMTAVGDVTLVGNTVTNRGTITGSTILMTGGLENNDDVTIKNIGDVISLRINGEDLKLDSTASAEDPENFYQPGAGVTAPTGNFSRGVDNTGTISASRHVALAAGDLYGFAIHNSGTISTPGGKLDAVATSGLVQNTGTMDASGSTGGVIRIAAPAVVTSGSILSNGASSGVPGVALPGGNITLSSGLNTVLTGQVAASAGLDGDGGIIAAVSDGSIIMDPGSTMTARGGTFSGNGGNLRLDGDTLHVQGFLRASRGANSPDDLGIITLNARQDLHLRQSLANVPWTLNNLGTPLVAASDSGVAVDSSLMFVDANLSIASSQSTLNFWTDLDTNPFTGNRRVQGDLAIKGQAGILLNQTGETRISADGNLWSAGNIDRGIGFDAGLVLDSGKGIGLVGNIGVGSTAPLTRVEFNADQFIALGDTSTGFATNAIAAEGDIEFNPGGNTWLRDTGISTVSVFSDTYDISSEFGDINFGDLQAIAVTGDLTMSGNTVTIGDVTSAGALEVNGSDIIIRLRDGLDIAYDGGLTQFSEGTQIVARDAIIFSQTPTYDTSTGLNPPHFGSNAGAEFTGTLAAQSWKEPLAEVTQAFLEVPSGNETLLGLMPLGPTITPPGPVPPGPTPPGPTPPGPSPDPTPTPAPVPTPVNPADPGLSDDAAALTSEISDSIAADSQIFPQEDAVAAPPEPGNAPVDLNLTDLGIELKPTPPGPRLSIVSDVTATTVGSLNGGMIQVSPQRLNAFAAQQAVKQYQDVIASQPGATEDTIAQRNTAEMATALTSAFSSYQAANADSAAPQDFSSWLNGSNETQAKTYLDGMQATFADLGRAGLNPTEVGQSRLFVAQRILGGESPSGLTPAGLAQAMR